MHTNASLIKCVILSRAYCTAHASVQAEVANVKYQYFDFHNECKNMRWDRINILVERMQDDLLRHGYGAVVDMNPPTQVSIAISTSTCLDLIL